MKFTKADKIALMINCPIFIFIGISFAAHGYYAGLAAVCFGIANLLLGIFMPESNWGTNMNVCYMSCEDLDTWVKTKAKPGDVAYWHDHLYDQHYYYFYWDAKLQNFEQ